MFEMCRWFILGLPIRTVAIKLIQFWFIISCLAIKQHVYSLPNKKYHVSTICSNDKFHTLPKLIDGAVISSNREENLNCIFTFTTESVLQKFMLKFDELKLDCNDHLYIYDGDIADGNPKADLSCRTTKNEIGTIFINSYFVTFKYITDQWSKDGDGFNLVITAFKDTAPANCNLFKCENMFCISPELACDGIDHCGDNTDETDHAFCPVVEKEVQMILGMEASAFLGLIIVMFIVCLICVIVMGFYLLRKSIPLNHHSSQSQMNLCQSIATPILPHPVSYSSALNGNGQIAARYSTLPLEKIRDNQMSSHSGNIYASVLANNYLPNSIPVQQVVYYSRK